MKPFVIFDEGHTAIQELTSTQTMITSLITDDSDQSQTKAIKELKTHIEQYEQMLIELKVNEDKDVSKILHYYIMPRYLLKSCNL